MNFVTFKLKILDIAQSAETNKCAKFLKTYPEFSTRILEISTKNGDSVVHLAAQSGCDDIIRYAYEQWGSKPLTQRNKDGKMPLHIAAHSGQLGCVQLLLSCKVPVDALKRADWTPLMLACTKSDINVVKALVAYGANPLCLNKDGWTAFHISTREGHVHIVRYLLEINPFLWKTVSKNGRTPLHTAALNGKIEIVKLLLNETDHEIDPVDSCGTTPLMDAVCGSHKEIVEVLVLAGASMTRSDCLGRNLLHLAAEVGNVECLNYFIHVNAIDINSISHHGLTCLHSAVKGKHFECIKQLLELGADQGIEDCKGRKALDYSSDENIPAIFQLYENVK